MRRFTIILSAFALLTACAEANHLGNPLTLPVRGLATAIENAGYDRERRQVKSYLSENAGGMRAEGFRGPVTYALLYTVPAPVREKVRQELIDVAHHPDFAEHGTIIVMVHRAG